MMAFVKIERVYSEKQNAHIFTKGICTLKFQEICCLLMGWAMVGSDNIVIRGSVRIHVRIHVRMLIW